MVNTVLPMDATIAVRINGRELGLVQSYERCRKTELVPVRAIGESYPTTFLPEVTYYTVTLRQLRPDCALLVQDLLDHRLRNFNLAVIENDVTFLYIGCEISSVASRCDGDRLLVEEIVVYARAFQQC